jgi:hypothetical protein
MNLGNCELGLGCRRGHGKAGRFGIDDGKRLARFDLTTALDRRSDDASGHVRGHLGLPVGGHRAGQREQARHGPDLDERSLDADGRERYGLWFVGGRRLARFAATAKSKKKEGQRCAVVHTFPDVRREDGRDAVRAAVRMRATRAVATGARARAYRLASPAT